MIKKYFLSGIFLFFGCINAECDFENGPVCEHDKDFYLNESIESALDKLYSLRSDLELLQVYQYYNRHIHEICEVILYQLDGIQNDMERAEKLSKSE